MMSSEEEDQITSFDFAANASRRLSRRRNGSTDAVSIAGTLKRGMRISYNPDDFPSYYPSYANSIKRTTLSPRPSTSQSMSSANVSSIISPPPKSPMRLKSPIKSPRRKKRGDGDDVSISSRQSVISSRRVKKLTLDDVVVEPQNVGDDVGAVINGLLDEMNAIRPEEGIRDTIGRKMAVTLKKMVKLSRGNDKIDPKVLTLTPFRLLILGAKPPFKAEHNVHFLSIKSVDSPSPKYLTITLANGKVFNMHMIGTEDAEHIVGRIALSIRTIFPGISLSRIMKASLEPLSRQKMIQTMLNQANSHEYGPCGNFTEMYNCICNFLSMPIREEVTWDVDTIYLSQNCKVLNLLDFELTEPKDYIPIVSVLKYNQWFTGLSVKNIRLSSDVLEVILRVIRKSNCLESLVLEGVGLKGDFAIKLAENLVENSDCKLTDINLTNNPLEDKAVLQIGNALAAIRNGSITSLNLSKTGLTTKSINSLCLSLRSRPSLAVTLKYLNLSDNIIKGEESEEIYNYLSSENSLEYLDLSGTDCAVEFYVSALSKGGIAHMKTLKLSNNNFLSKGQKHPHCMDEEYRTARKNKETLPQSFCEFFSKTNALEEIDLSQMKVPPDAIKHMMEGLSMNNCQDLQVSINLSSCELKAAGAQMLGTCVGNLHNLVSLDISDNNFDSELPLLLRWIQQNKSIRNLNIGRNFASIKPKNMRNAMDAIVNLVQEDGSNLHTLSLTDSRLREHSYMFLSCLGSNTSLTNLDISGNSIGDVGARTLAKSLQINAKLRVLVIDRNNITTQGFYDIANALDKNYSLRYIPYPVNDVVASMKQQPDRTQMALAKIQDTMLRNSSDNNSTHDQQFRMQHAMAGTGQLIVDKLAGKVDDAVVAIELLDSNATLSNDIVHAKGLIKDAQNSKQLLSDMYGIGVEKTAGDESPLNVKLQKMAEEMDTMVEEHIKSTVVAMTTNAGEQCPNLYKSIDEDLNRILKGKSHLPDNYVRDHVMKEAGKEINNRVSDLNLVVATIISDKVTDALLEALSQCNISLTEKLNQQKQKGSENEKSKQAISPTHTDSDSDAVGDDTLPNIRKQRAASIAKRKQRPTSSSVSSESDVKTEEKTIPIPELTVTHETEETEEDDLTEEKEPVYTQIKKKPSKKESLEEKEKVEEEVVEDNKETEPEEEMVVVDGKSEGSSDEVKSRDASPLPDLTVENSKKLDHVTKNRAKGPTARRNRGRPTKRVVKKEEEEVVDDFFSTNVANANFDNVPTLEEEKEIAAKEKAETKKPRKMPGGMPGMPLVTPDMLKKKSSLRKGAKLEEESSKKEDEKENEDEEKAEEEEVKSPLAKKKPAGAMGLPGMGGMGFGGNVMAEIKLKKLNKSKSPEKAEPDPPSEEKSSPFGPRLLKKTPKSAEANKDANNTNSNNNVPISPTTTPKRWKSKSLEKKDKPALTPKQDNPPTSPKTKKLDSKPAPIMPPKLPTKPSSVKGRAPPPLPTKPKPKTGIHAVNKRPMSEFISSDKVPSTVKSRISSWGRNKKSDEKEAH